MKLALLFGGVGLILGSCSQIDKQQIDRAIKVVNSQIQPSQKESISATKQAIQKGVEFGVQILGKKDGFWASTYRLAIPQPLQESMGYARELGLGNQVDKFEKSLNRAAETATKSALPIFRDAIQQMTINDVIDILKGPDDAATNYFKSKSKDKLIQTFKPIVDKATQATNVTRYYKDLVVPLAPLATLAGLKIPAVSLEDYVAEQAAAALFKTIAVEEAKIRKNPAARTTELLRKVFGFYQRKP